MNCEKGILSVSKTEKKEFIIRAKIIIPYFLQCITELHTGRTVILRNAPCVALVHDILEMNISLIATSNVK